MGSELVSADIGIPEISPIKSEVDIKTEPEESSSDVKTETDDIKPKVEAVEGTHVKPEAVAGKIILLNRRLYKTRLGSIPHPPPTYIIICLPCFLT